MQRTSWSSKHGAPAAGSAPDPPVAVRLSNRASQNHPGGDAKARFWAAQPLFTLLREPPRQGQNRGAWPGDWQQPPVVPPRGLLCRRFLCSAARAPASPLSPAAPFFFCEARRFCRPGKGARGWRAARKLQMRSDAPFCIVYLRKFQAKCRARLLSRQAPSATGAPATADSPGTERNPDAAAARLRKAPSSRILAIQETACVPANATAQGANAPRQEPGCPEGSGNK